jgi:serine/threonine protein kinase
MISMSETQRKDNKSPGEEELPTTASSLGSEFKPGHRIGSYKLLSIVGEGGFALVYLAEQERPVRRRVALKVIKPGMDSKQVISRFEAERQALALLNHPNVAHVYDAGTTEDGYPYFVMEYVKGMSLTGHCERQKLTVEERITLFLQVCEAVQHAHQKGIIHRDIKPSNIQVCIEGERIIPKVIDFGIAKALSQPLTDRTLLTEEGQMIGTPEYMSPEQAEMTHQDIDTRTDIYSLGVLLYELLTGVLPFESKILRAGSFDQIRQIIREESPKIPSIQVSSLKAEEATELARCCRTDIHTLQRKLRGDLDWITLKALEKDRTHRYQTAHAMAEDIQRHLNHEPVLAGPPSKIYRLKKFIRKHRAQAVRAATTAILLVAVGMISVLYFQEKDRAEKERSIKHQTILSEVKELRLGGQFEKALDRVGTILNSEHFGRDARLLRAQLLIQLGHLDNSIAELEQLLSRPDTITCQAHYILAWIYRNSQPEEPEMAGEFQLKAEYHKQMGDELLSDNAEACFNRAMIASSLEKRLEYLNKAVDLDRRHYDSLKARALVYYATKEYHKMERDAVAMITVKDQDPLGYSFLAIAVRQTGDFAVALENHNRAIELSRDDPELYNQRYETYHRMGNYQDALKDARSCVKLATEQLIYHFHLFTTLVLLEDYEAARKEYSEIVGTGSKQKSLFEAWIGRYIFKVLGAGRKFELPDRIAGDEAFSAMQKAFDYYRNLENQARRLVPGVFGQSSWSPDGKQLAYGRSGMHAWEAKSLTAGAPALSGSGGIEILDLESNTTRLLVSFGRDPAWSPDGNDIAFVRGAIGVREQPEEVWIIPAKGGEPRRLAEGGWPIWTNDPDRLFFHSREQKTLCSIRTDILAAKPKHIIACPSQFPAVSPDTNYVAYAEGGELKIAEVSSGSVETSWIAPTPVIELLLRWSPDGNELSVGGSADSDLGLWIFDVKRKKAWQLFDRPAISGIWLPKRSAIVVEIKGPYEENWLVTLDANIPTYESLPSARTQEEYLQHMREQYINEIKTEITKTDQVWANIYLRKLAWVSRSQYHIGAYGDALDTLAEVEKFQLEFANNVYPTNVAFFAMALKQVGKQQEAQAALDRLRLLLEDGEHPRAEKYLCETEQLLAGNNSKVYGAWELIKAEKLEEASRLVEKLRSLLHHKDRETAGRVRSVFKALARSYYNRGRRAKHHGHGYTEAVADYKTAVRNDPNFARAFSDLGYLQAAHPNAIYHDVSKAIKNATKACELTYWKDYRYISTLADVYARLGDFDMAIKWQKTAIKLLSEDRRVAPRASYDWQLNLYKLGQPYNQVNPCSFLTGRLVAWWKLDEVSGRIAEDSSGSGYVGKLKGDPQWQPSGGKVGGALEFDGEGDYIEVSDESSFDFLDEITIAAWINITTVPRQWTAIVTKGNSAWRLSTWGDKRKLHFAITGVGLGSSWVQGEKEVSSGEWHHVVGTYDGANVRLYVDGMEDQASPVAYDAGLTTNNFTVCIGGNSERPERCWSGLIDDVRIYSYALSLQEIKAICGGEGSYQTTQITEVRSSLIEK